jgi:hypothetical protein
MLILTTALLGQANLTQHAVPLNIEPISEDCTLPLGDCSKTHCCSNPTFACLTQVAAPHNQQCRRRPFSESLSCVDSAEWRCPRAEMCADIFQDCRTSLCCRTKPYFRGRRDVAFECVRRPHVYYAQCRPPPEPPSNCTDSEDWLCPGWDRCGSAHEECTHSRCCVEGYACMLNATALESGGGWHAYCRPAVDAVTDDWLSPSLWMSHVYEAEELAAWCACTKLRQPTEVPSLAAHTAGCIV